MKSRNTVRRKLHNFTYLMSLLVTTECLHSLGFNEHFQSCFKRFFYFTTFLKFFKVTYFYPTFLHVCFTVWHMSVNSQTHRVESHVMTPWRRSEWKADTSMTACVVAALSRYTFKPAHLHCLKSIQLTTTTRSKTSNECSRRRLTDCTSSYYILLAKSAITYYPSPLPILPGLQWWSFSRWPALLNQQKYIHHRGPAQTASFHISLVVIFSARCNIYISRLCYDVSVCLSVRLSVTEVHWHIIANLGFKFRSHFTAHCGRRAACERIISRHASKCYFSIRVI